MNNLAKPTQGFVIFASMAGIWIAGSALIPEIVSTCSGEPELTHKLLDSVDDSAVSKIRRNESEYSLGLTRSKSFDNIATALGEFCSTGQVLISMSKYACVAATAIGIGIQIIGYIHSRKR